MPPCGSDQAIDDYRAGDTLGLSLEIGENAMGENRVGDGFEILHSHQVAAVENGVGLSTTNEVLDRSWTCTPCDPLLDGV